MAGNEFSVSALMDLLVAKVGLPKSQRVDSPDVTLAELGLDSLAFIQLQAEISDVYGVELPDKPGCSFTAGDIVSTVTALSYEGSLS